jgi:ketosteroid isomerase-like protein
MSPDPAVTHAAKVVSVRTLYRALAAGDKEELGKLLHPDFVGHATEGLPLGVGGRHVGPDAMRREVGPTRAFARMRRLLRDSWHSDLATQLQSEVEALKAAADTADAAEALAAFRAKRSGRFTGR